MMSGFPPVVRATVDGHRVVVVRCSNVPDRPWLVVDVGKGWTIARADCELEEKVALGPVKASAKAEPVTVAMNRDRKVTVGGNAPAWAERMVAEMIGAKPPVPSRWRIESVALAGDGFEGPAAEVWAQLVSVIDHAWTVESIEEYVDGSWRRRSVRDLLEAAGGDPL